MIARYRARPLPGRTGSPPPASGVVPLAAFALTARPCPPPRMLRLSLSVALALTGLLLTVAACTGVRPVAPLPESIRGPVIERGTASWYGSRFHGRRTASGERYDMHDLTAAHPTLEFGTRIEVRNLANGRSIVVRVNDRGPFVRGRIIDLSYAAARRIGLVGPGTGKVELVLLSADEEPSLAAFAVQVAAFSEAARAAALREILVDRYPVVAVRSDATWHRVQVGHFDRREGAEALRRELESLGWAAVVVTVSGDRPETLLASGGG